jgi:hypothetical protein
LLHNANAAVIGRRFDSGRPTDRPDRMDELRGGLAGGERSVFIGDLMFVVMFCSEKY